jgi:hypothetical protein
MVMTFFTSKRDAVWTPAAGTTEVYDRPNNQQGLTSNMLAFYNQSEKGNTGSKTATASIRDYWVAQQIAIRPSTQSSGLVNGRLSGTTSISSNTSQSNNMVPEVQPASSGAALVSYPNPATDQVSVALPAHVGKPAEILIADRTGRTFTVPSEWRQDDHVLSLDISSLNKGLYIIRLRTEQGVNFVKVLKD